MDFIKTHEFREFMCAALAAADGPRAISKCIALFSDIDSELSRLDAICVVLALRKINEVVCLMPATNAASVDVVKASLELVAAIKAFDTMMTVSRACEIVGAAYHEFYSAVDFCANPSCDKLLNTIDEELDRSGRLNTSLLLRMIDGVALDFAPAAKDKAIRLCAAIETLDKAYKNKVT